MKKYILLTLVFINAALLYTTFSSRPNSIDSYLGTSISKETLDNYIQQRMEELNIHGLSFAIINDGQVVHHNSFGYANVEQNLPITDKTIFEGASMSKPVFAFFVMTFVEEGKLDLDRPLYEYYPHPDIALDDHHKKITARMVLSHQSGFPNWREDEADGQLRIHFEPGTDYLYSGEGYQYLAMVLREIEQTDWAGLEAIFQERVAQPLGLEHTVFIQTPYTRANKAEPYDTDGQWMDWPNSYYFLKEDGTFYAPSSIHSEPQDFSKWMLAVMNEDLLTEESYAELLKPHSVVPSEQVSLLYTLGFFNIDLPFTDIYSHSGDNHGFDSWFALDVEQDWGYVLFMNSDNGRAMGEDIFFYLLTGPDVNQLLITIGVFVLTLFLFLGLGVRSLVLGRREKQPRPTLTGMPKPVIT
ncbi:MAG: serine hydrolase domain-containing protein [Chloroflexota bacterium]